MLFLSAGLVAEGQMIRRERSFEGVEVNYISLNRDGNRDFGVEDLEKKHLSIADKITDILRGIIRFEEKYIKAAVAELDGEVKSEMKEVEKRKGTAQLGVSSTPYFSKLFMVINRMLFSIKTESVVVLDNAKIHRTKKVIRHRKTLGEERTFHLLSSPILPTSQPCGNALENTQGQVDKADYVSKDNLFYAANRDLANVGKVLYVKFGNHAA